MNSDNKQQPEENSFLAGFAEDDSVQLASTPKPIEETPPVTDPNATPGSDGGEGGEENVPQGVDTPQNGEQVAPQSSEIAIDDLPDELRQKVAAILDTNKQLESERAELRRNYESLHGRVAPLQRELDRIRHQPAPVQPPQQQAAPQPQPSAPARLSMVDAANAQFESDEFKSYEQMFPEEAAIQRRNTLAIAQASDARLAQLEGLVGTTLQQVRSIDEERAQARKLAEISELDKAHPDWRELDQDPDFNDWLDSRVDVYGFRDEADKIRRFNDRKFVTALLDDYKTYRGFGSQANSTPPPATTQQGTPQSADAVVALAAAPTIKGNGIRRTAGEGRRGNDFMAGFNSED